MGNGWKSQTDRNSRPIPVSDVLEIIDTPGVDDTKGRDAEAQEAMVRASCVIVMLTNLKDIGEQDMKLLRLVYKAGKKCILLCNCMKGDKRSQWDPSSKANQEFCASLRTRILEEEGLSSMVLSVTDENGSVKDVFPVNLQWALFGLGLLDPKDGEAVEDVLDRCETAENALERSNFRPLDRFLKSLPLEMLKNTAKHPERELDRFVERFVLWFEEKTKEAM